MSNPEKAVEAAARTAREADEALTLRMIEAREAGVSWARLAEASGLTVQAARWRLGALTRPGGYVEERRAAGAQQALDDEAERVRAANDGQDPAPLGTERVTMVEASRMLGIARPTLYTWLNEGRLPVDETSGRRAVVVDPVTGRIAVAPRGTYSDQKSSI